MQCVRRGCEEGTWQSTPGNCDALCYATSKLRGGEVSEPGTGLMLG